MVSNSCYPHTEILWNHPPPFLDLLSVTYVFSRVGLIFSAPYSILPCPLNCFSTGESISCRPDSKTNLILSNLLSFIP